MGRLRRLGPVFRSKDAVNSGVSWRDLYRLRDDGEIVELSRGLFQLAESAGIDNIDFVTVSARAPHGMICLNSALAHWDLSDEIPAAVHIAVPEGSHRPAINFPPTTVHVFRAPTFALGRIRVRQEHNERFWISDRERTIVDAFRMRHVVGEDIANGALKRYLRDRPKQGRVAEMARALRAWTPIASAIRVLEA